MLDLLAAGAPATSGLGSLTMGDLDIGSSPLAAISAVGLELGNTPVRDLVTVDGVGSRQGCLVPVREGMKVETQLGRREAGR